MAQPVYMVDFSVYNPPEELKVDYKASTEAAWKWDVSTSCSVARVTAARVVLGTWRGSNAAS